MRCALGLGKGMYLGWPQGTGFWNLKLWVSALKLLGECPSPLPPEAENTCSLCPHSCLDSRRKDRVREKGLWMWMPPFLSSLCYHSIVFPWLPVAKERTLGKCRILMELSKERCQHRPCLI